MVWSELYIYIEGVLRVCSVVFIVGLCRMAVKGKRVDICVDILLEGSSCGLFLWCLGFSEQFCMEVLSKYVYDQVQWQIYIK